MAKIMKKVSPDKTPDLIVLQKTALMRLATEKGKVEQAKDMLLGVSVFPASIKPSSVKVRFHGTFNMGNYSSLQASIEIEDFTLPNPVARKLLSEQLQTEALDMVSKAVKKAAQQLFNADVDVMKGHEDAGE